MFTDTPDEITVEIQEETSGETERHRRHWTVRIDVKNSRGESLDSWTRNVSDPFKSRSDRNLINEYLNDTLDKRLRIKPEKARKCESIINSHGRSLFQSLGLDVNNRASFFFGKDVNIQVSERSLEHDGNAIKKETASVQEFYNVHWELLEDLAVWAGLKPASVTVRRLVQDLRARMSLPSQCSTKGEHRAKEPFNILLIVARKNINDTDERQPDLFNPTSVLRSILGVHAELECRWASKRIRLEVVRPGSYDELKSHLSKSGKAFQLVHFDVHGDVSDKSGAYLIFNNYSKDHSLEEVEVCPRRLARLLRKHKIQCAVFNSCKTAVADSNVNENLSWSFLEEGIPLVLAISYNIPDTMCQLFYTRLYHEIFVNHAEFGQAAAIARQEVRNKRGRYSYVQRMETEMTDWFIPKVYQNSALSQGDMVLFPGPSIPKWMTSAEFQLISILVLPAGYLLQSWGLYVSALDSSGLQRFRMVAAWRIICCIVVVISVTLYLSRKWYKWHLVRQLKSIDRDRKNILRIEGNLRYSRQIFLHAENDRKCSAHTLVDTLSNIWCRTHLVQRRMIVEAEWFIGLRPLQGNLLYNLRRFWFSHYGWGFLHFWFFELLSTSLRLTAASPGAGTVVVVVNMKDLFPVTNAQEYQLDAQGRFSDWAERHFAPIPDTAAGCVRNSDYLVLIGEGRPKNTQQWVQSTIGTCSALKRTIFTAYADPERLGHIFERPLTSHNRL